MTLIIYACLKRKYPRNGNPKMELETFPNVVHSLKKGSRKKIDGWAKVLPTNPWCENWFSCWWWGPFWEVWKVSFYDTLECTLSCKRLWRHAWCPHAIICLLVFIIACFTHYPMLPGSLRSLVIVPHCSQDCIFCTPQAFKRTQKKG